MTFTKWCDVPLVLRTRQYAALMNISYETARHQVSRGTCDVPPSMVRPYRWCRDDVRHHIDGSNEVDDRRRKAKQRTEPRTVPAELDGE